MKGKCWKFGDNINTDEIIPARYLNTIDAKELAAHCMEDADPNFIKRPGLVMLLWQEIILGAVHRVSMRQLLSKLPGFRVSLQNHLPAYSLEMQSILVYLFLSVLKRPNRFGKAMK